MYVTKLSDDIIEVEYRTLGKVRDELTYIYYNIKTNVRYINKRDHSRLTLKQLTEETMYLEIMDNYDIERLHEFIIPTMNQQIIRREENRFAMEKFEAEVKLRNTMDAEFSSRSNFHWNSLHGFDKYGRLIFGTDDVEIEKENKQNIFQSNLKIELLTKYYGAKSGEEYRQKLLLNNPGYKNWLESDLV